MPRWYIKGRENFPTIAGCTIAKDSKKAAQNVGWRNGLRGDDLIEFEETATFSQVSSTPEEEAGDPEYELDDLLGCKKFLKEMGIDYSMINEMIEKEIKKISEAKQEQEQQLLFVFPPQKK